MEIASAQPRATRRIKWGMCMGSCEGMLEAESDFGDFSRSGCEAVTSLMTNRFVYVKVF